MGSVGQSGSDASACSEHTGRSEEIPATWKSATGCKTVCSTWNTACTEDASLVLQLVGPLVTDVKCTIKWFQ